MVMIYGRSEQQLPYHGSILVDFPRRAVTRKANAKHKEHLTPAEYSYIASWNRVQGNNTKKEHGLRSYIVRLREVRQDSTLTLLSPNGSTMLAREMDVWCDREWRTFRVCRRKWNVTFETLNWQCKHLDV